MNKNKALIFYGGFLHRAGGAFFHACNMEKGLKHLNWDIEIITLDKLPIWCRYLPAFIERIINYFVPPYGFIYKALITKFFYKFFFNNKSDLFIFEDIYLSWNSTTPSLSILHAVWSDNLQAFNATPSREAYLRSHEAALINDIKHPVVTVSEPYKEYICNSHFQGALKKDISVIELGIDVSKRHIINNTSNKKSLVYTGSLEARKNLFFLLDIFGVLFEKDSSYSLTIVGDGPDKLKLIKKAQQKNLPIHFLGKLDYSGVVEELPRHQIYVHTSTKESFSYSLLEAKLAGLKTFAYSGLEVPPEFIDVGLDSFNIDKWVKAIHESSDKINKIDKKKYTIKHMVKKTLSLANNA